MTFFKLIIKSILHYRRQHLALFAGTLLSTAILTGALITGDSVEYSLRKMVDLRLGKVGFALETGDRFVRSDLAKDLSQKLNCRTSAILQTQGIASNPSTGKRANKIEVLGIDDDFINLSNIKFPNLKPGQAIISQNLAEKLEIKTGDNLILRIESTSVIPINAPFAEDNSTAEPVRLKVVGIAGNDKLGRFSLQNNQMAPCNIFVSRHFLAGKLGLTNLANIILIENKNDLSVEKLNRIFAESWKLEDAGLKIESIEGANVYQLTSNRIFIDRAVSDAIKNLNLNHQPVLTYLINEISFGKESTPYSFVTASAPPVLPEKINDNEIIINSWLANDLKIKIHDTLTLNYFVIGAMRKLLGASRDFVVKEIIPLNDSPDSRSLMPDFPGMANAGSCSDWSTGVPINLEMIRDKDEKYWDNYRGTPKAFISIEAGKQIWANSFGNYTAFRFPEKETSKVKLEKQILSVLDPVNLGLQFKPVRQEGFNAVNNAVDFGELFLSLSFFVIAAGVLLTALLFSLHVASRNREGGVLAAIGFSRKQIIRFRITEALFVIIAGSVAGTFTGILYNSAIMSGLNTVWQDVVRTNMLWIHVEPITLFIGAVSGIVIAFATIFFITRRKMKQPINALITKAFSQQITNMHSKFIWNTLLIIFGLGSSIALVIFSILSNVDQNSGLFLPAGGLFLVGFLALVFRLLEIPAKKFHISPLSLWQLSLKNAGRNKTGSMATIALLALGTFTIIITGANQQSFYGASNNRTSGTGGFLFWSENSVPLIYDLNSTEGKEKYGLEDEPALDEVKFVQFHNLPGDDASCLNLNQVSQPQILGIKAELFDKQGSFSFANLLKDIDKEHPWLSLNQETDNNIIPAIADQTVITWGLMKKVGDTLNYLNEQGKEIKLLLVGSLKNSVFQGNILISDSLFIANFPSAGGSKIMLIDAPMEKTENIKNLLEERFIDFGIEITPTTTRLATFNSVTNTYLSVFMILGGLGVLIGTIGLGIVLLRNIMERKSELALLSAIGYRNNKILKLVFTENFILLVAGIISGILSALIGILPSLLSASYTMNTPVILLLIAIVFLSGLLWIYIPARYSLKKFTVKDLQGE